jgi:hypothetical protein
MTGNEGFYVDREGLDRLTHQLRDAAGHLEGAAKSPPSMPQLTVSSQKVGEALSTVEKTIAGLIASAHKNADDVHASNGTYGKVEDDNIDLLQH